MFFLSHLCLYGCILGLSVLAEPVSIRLPVDNKPITILIHGTRFPHVMGLPIPLLAQQTITPPGLYKIQDVSTLYFNVRLGASLSAYAPDYFPAENFYIFGWKGSLSFKVREYAGEVLYYALKELRATMPTVPITIIAMSHGANVVLNMARAADKYHDTEFFIDTVIFCAAPVQDATACFIDSPLFKTIFNFYSRGDVLQIADPQGLYVYAEIGVKPTTTFFSRRVFDSSCSRLIQAELYNGRLRLGHFDFVLLTFYEQLLAIMHRLKNPETCSKLPLNELGSYCVDLQLV